MLFRRKKSISDSGIIRASSDRHSHILWGVDDGISTEEESLGVLSYLESEGLEELWLTPHIAEDMPNTTDALMRRFGELEALYRGPVSLRIASEYMLDTLFEERLSRKDLLTMEDDMILLETSAWNPPMGLYEILDRTMQAGFRPLLAHPERYRYMNDEDYHRLSEMGVLFQLNLPSLAGFYGETARKKAESLLERGLYSFWGSDCHRLEGLRKVYEAKELGRKVAEKVKDMLND